MKYIIPGNKDTMKKALEIIKRMRPCILWLEGIERLDAKGGQDHESKTKKEG